MSIICNPKILLKLACIFLSTASSVNAFLIPKEFTPEFTTKNTDGRYVFKKAIKAEFDDSWKNRIMNYGLGSLWKSKNTEAKATAFKCFLEEKKGKLVQERLNQKKLVAAISTSHLAGLPLKNEIEEACRGYTRIESNTREYHPTPDRIDAFGVQSWANPEELIRVNFYDPATSQWVAGYIYHTNSITTAKKANKDNSRYYTQQ